MKMHHPTGKTPHQPGKPERCTSSKDSFNYNFDQYANINNILDKVLGTNDVISG